VTVTLFSAGPMCSGCQAIKALLDSYRIRYEEKDIRKVDTGWLLTELRCSGHNGKISGLLVAPVLAVGDRYYLASDLLDESGQPSELAVRVVELESLK